MVSKETKLVSGLEDHLGYWLRFVSNHVSQAFAVKTAAEDISIAEWVVLRELYETTMPPSAVAEKIGMTRGAVTKIVDRLAAKGLTSRTANDQDKRAQWIDLTETGRQTVHRLAALADANDAEFFGHLPPSDREALTRILREIVTLRQLSTAPTE